MEITLILAITLALALIHAIAQTRKERAIKKLFQEQYSLLRQAYLKRRR